MTTYWVTKYAMTTGIISFETDKEPNQHGIIQKPGIWSMSFFVNKDCFDDHMKAIAKAEDMRIKKIASLQRSLKKIQELKFS